jgi:hypothetical protein
VTLSTSMARLFLSIAIAVTLASGEAAAQTCGDADGNGSVSVTDGVQVLRFAAGLASSCTDARCDVDGSGGVTVTDGVNVLRRVAGLSAPSACPGGGGDGVQESIDAIVPFLAFGFEFVGDVGLSATSAAAPAGGLEESDCPDGGVRTKRDLGGILVIGFDACRYSNAALGRFEFEQSLAVNFIRAEVALDVLVTDLDSGRAVELAGAFTFTPRGGGGFIGDGEDILITTPQGDFTLDLNALTVDGDGHVLSGGGSIEDTDGNFALARIDFEVTGPGTGQLTATFDDGSTKSFALNLVTGDLTAL